MTFHKLALSTALASVTAFAAQADNHDTEPEPAQEEELVPDTEVDIPEATVNGDGEITAPRSQSLMGTEPDPVDETSVENIIKAVEDGATVDSVDGYIIGEAVSHSGDGGAEHLIHVEVHEDANLAAERIAFEASSLRNEQVGGLQYEYTLEQLREAVAARVAAMAE